MLQAGSTPRNSSRAPRPPAPRPPTPAEPPVAPLPTDTLPTDVLPLAETERRAITRALEASGNNVTRAAQALGTKPHHPPPQTEEVPPPLRRAPKLTTTGPGSARGKAAMVPGSGFLATFAHLIELFFVFHVSVCNTG